MLEQKRSKGPDVPNKVPKTGPQAPIVSTHGATDGFCGPVCGLDRVLRDAIRKGKEIRESLMEENEDPCGGEDDGERQSLDNHRKWSRAARPPNDAPEPGSCRGGYGTNNGYAGPKPVSKTGRGSGGSEKRTLRLRGWRGR